MPGKLGLGPRIACRIAIQCPVCDQYPEPHAPNCLAKQLDNVCENRPQIGCPKCRGQVDVNIHDFYECMECHTQFSASEMTDIKNPEETILIDFRADRHFSVLVLEKKGEGNFPTETRIESLRARIKAILESKKPKRKRK